MCGRSDSINIQVCENIICCQSIEVHSLLEKFRMAVTELQGSKILTILLSDVGRLSFFGGSEARCMHTDLSISKVQ